MIISFPLTLFFTRSSLIPRLPRSLQMMSSHGYIVFSYACCEYYCVDTVHLGDIRSDIEPYPVSEHLECQESSFIAFLCRSFYVSEVAGNARYSKNARFLFSIWFITPCSSFSFSLIYVTMAGSISPLLVPITSPSRGVNPMVYLYTSLSLWLIQKLRCQDGTLLS